MAAQSCKSHNIMATLSPFLQGWQQKNHANHTTAEWCCGTLVPDSSSEVMRYRQCKFIASWHLKRCLAHVHTHFCFRVAISLSHLSQQSTNVRKTL
jgi:hypothetical protein